MTGEPFDLLEAPGHLIRRAQQLHAALWAESVDPELTSMQFAVLITVDERPGVDQRTLGETLSIDGSTIADVCQRLAARGLLVRERTTGDARRYGLRITPTARRRLRRLVPRVHALGEELLAPLGERDRRHLLRLLRMLVVRDQP